MGEIENSLGETAGMIRSNLPKIPLPDNSEDYYVKKIRKWALIILSGLIGGVALILIIKSIINKVL